MRYSIFLALVVAIVLNSCKKYLDEKPDIELAIAQSLSDYQYLMDHDLVHGQSAPQIADLSCDDYSLKESFFQSTSARVRAAYSWASDTWVGASAGDWDNPYKAIYQSNVVLDGLKKFQTKSAGEQIEKAKITGHALFVRAFMHYYLEETFGQPYKPASSGSDLGVPLRLNSAIEGKVERTTTGEVLQQIVADLRLATELLPVDQPAVSRPCRASAWALLARVYLTMQDYQNAETAATNCIQSTTQHSLLDFNDIRINTTVNPFSSFPLSTNPVPEILYVNASVSYGIFRATGNGVNVVINPDLYNAYDNNDRRKQLYYQPSGSTFYLRGDYMASSLQRFYGIGLNEVYLTRAECRARAGNKTTALADLDILLQKRWKNSVPFPASTAADAEEALRKILLERRKELIFRGVRWADLRRLNQDPRFAYTLRRPTILGQNYELRPNDLRYAFLIPQNEINMTGLIQNPR